MVILNLCIVLLILSHASFTSAVEPSNSRLAHRGETRLRQVLEQYRQIKRQGGWAILPEGPTLRPGDTDMSILMLRMRLQTTKDASNGTHIHTSTRNRMLFDNRLASAVRRFQHRHGLVEDGILGPATRAALQVSIEDRIQQLSHNLDRWQRLPPYLGPHYIWVNIPAFTLEVFERDQVVMTMRVVVGKPSWPTPVLRGQMATLVLNPTWYIPPRIVQEEIMPRLQRDPTYLTTHNIVVSQGRGASSTDIDPATVNWSQVPLHAMSYRFRQQPGPTNPLGRVKFLMPNPFHITLHDTPSRALFAKPIRAKSHGCIRVEKPIALAQYLLRKDPKWPRTAILHAIDQGTSQRVSLPVPIPVYLIYHTAWVDQDGRVHFRPDIYQQDMPSPTHSDADQPLACG